MARLGFQTGDSVSRTAPRIRAFTRRRGVVGDARRADAQHHRERRNGRLAGHRSADGKRVAATIRVATPSSNVNWQVGSSHSICWTHNLGSTLLNRFDIAVSYDSGHTWAGIADRVNNGYNFYSWVVTGAVTDRARVRVRWTDGTASAEDISDVDFRRGWSAVPADSATTGSFVIVTPGYVTNQALVRVTASGQTRASDSDTSDVPFTILPARIILP